MINKIAKLPIIINTNKDGGIDSTKKVRSIYENEGGEFFMYYKGEYRKITKNDNEEYHLDINENDIKINKNNKKEKEANENLPEFKKEIEEKEDAPEENSQLG